jgi:hypothetical protein
MNAIGGPVSQKDARCPGILRPIKNDLAPFNPKEIPLKMKQVANFAGKGQLSLQDFLPEVRKQF